MIRFLTRFLGLWLVAIALVTLVVDGTKTISAANWITTPIGQYWFDFAPEALNTAQAAIQRHVAPFLWDPVIQGILIQPVWAVAGPLGILLMWLGEPRRRRRRGLRPA